MDARRLTGPGASAEKYDILTAIAVAGLSGSATTQSTMFRLIALVTARYNWAKAELTAGQREMARMWSVNERTAKREVKRMIEAGLLILIRPGARGRVATYRLNLPQLYRLSEPVWQRVGPDFAERMDQRQPKQVSTVVRVDFQARNSGQAGSESSAWQRSRDRLEAENPDIFGAWFSKLQLRRNDETSVVLEAPNNFIAQYIRTHFSGQLLAAVRAEFGRGIELSLLAATG